MYFSLFSWLKGTFHSLSEYRVCSFPLFLEEHYVSLTHSWGEESQTVCFNKGVV
jgi:hypothetical protein